MSAALATAPTEAQYIAYNLAFDFFNDRLWGGALPPCLLTFSLRNKKAMGYYYPRKWTHPSSGAVAAEISLNPEHLKDRDLLDVLSTLVHEMAHHWQYILGDPPRSGYHDRQWAAEMKRIGLYPSSTGEPGGKETGQRCSHYIIVGGAYEAAFRDLPEEAALPWTTAFVDPNKASKKKPWKVSYTCGCRHFQAKAGLTEIICGFCGGEFEQHPHAPV